MPEHTGHIALALGFVAMSLLSTQVRQRSMIESGLLFVLLGLAIGPMGFDLAPSLNSTPWAIATSLVCGWVALEVGLGASLRSDSAMAPGAMRAGLLYVLVGIIGLSVASFGVLEALLGGEQDTTWVYAALIIACSGVAAAPSVLAQVAATHNAEGTVRDAGKSLARSTCALALVIVSVVAAVAEPQVTVEGFRALAPTERILAELMMGITLGFCADVFLSNEPDDRRMVTMLICLSMLATGLAMHIGLSPLLVNLLIGVSLSNYGHLPASRHRAAQALEGPARSLLLVAMGALWVLPSDGALWLVALLIFGARTAMLRIAGGVAGRAFDRGHAGFRVIGFTLVSQGAPALAIVLMHLRGLNAEVAPVVVTVVILGAMVNDLWAPKAARSVLDEAGEIPTGLVEV